MTRNTAKDLNRIKTWKILDWPSKSLALKPTELDFTLQRGDRKGESSQNKQQPKTITKGECNSVLMSVSPWLKVVMACKRYATKYQGVPILLFSPVRWSDTSGTMS